MIYAYGICEAGAADPPPGRRGLGDAQLRSVRADDLAAVYSRHHSLRPRPSTEAVLAHERVLEAIMERGPVLPLRFGAQLSCEDDLVAVLAQRREELLRALVRVRGRVELGLRALPAATASDAAREGSGDRELSGREYLLGRLREHRDAERTARELHAPLAALARGALLQERPPPPAILVGSYLVDEARVEEFRARAGEVAARRGDLQVVVTGPWPPYSFTADAPL